MDVTCERCGTEYDFDETLVSERGTTVKCTNCGHLFKVFRPGAADGSSTRPWIVRRGDGVTETLPTLRELQRRITEGALSTEDLISRSGEAWKRLGDIAELETFFEAARAAAAASSGRRRDETGPRPVGSAPYAAAPSSRPGPPAGDAWAQDARAVAPTLAMPHPGVPVPPPSAGASAPPPGAGSPAATARGPMRRGTMLGLGGGAPSTPPPAVAPPPATPPPVAAAAAAPSSPAHVPPGPDAARTAPTGRGVSGGRTLLGVPGAADAADTLPAHGMLGGVAPAGLRSDGPPAASHAASQTLDARAPRSVPPQGREPTGARPREGRAIPPTAQYPAEEVRRHAEGYAAAREVVAHPGPSGPASAPPGPSPSTPPARQRREAVASVPPPRLDEDDAAGPRRPARRSAAPWLALGALLAAGGGAAFAWPQIAPRLGLAEPGGPAAPFLARGDEALARDDTAGFRTAISEYTKALAFDDRDPRALVALSRANAVWAQALAFDAEDLEARAGADPALRGEASRVRDEQRAHVGEALRMAEDALRRAPADADVELALADAMRLAGDRSGARAHLDRARTLDRAPSAEALRVEALLAADVAGSIAAARPHAEAAIALDPAMLRARLVLARAMLAAGDVAAARAHIDAILTRVPGHERATALRDAIDRGVPPAAPVVAVGTPGPGSAAGAAAGAGATQPPGPPASPSGTPAGGQGAGAAGVPAAVAAGAGAGAGTSGQGGAGSGAGGGAPAGRSYDWYVDRGATLLESGRVAEARQHFEAALNLQAEGSAARAGLGDVALELGDFAGAAAQYRGPAARGYGPALLGLGRAQERLGRHDDARNAYCEYLERFGGSRDANIARAGLARMSRDCAGGAAGGGAGGTTAGSGGGPDGPREGGGGGAPDTRPNELPAPAGATAPPPSSDSLAIGSER